MLRVRWAGSEEDSEAIVAAYRAGEPKILGLCDLAWIEGTIRLTESAEEVIQVWREQDAAWKVYEELLWQERARAEVVAPPRPELRCQATPEPGMRFCKGHGRNHGEPDLVRQAKAREALRKLTKGMTRTVEEDGTEVYE